MRSLIMLCGLILWVDGLVSSSFAFLCSVYKFMSMSYMKAFAMGSLVMFFRFFAVVNSPNARLTVEYALYAPPSAITLKPGLGGAHHA